MRANYVLHSKKSENQVFTLYLKFQICIQWL